MTPSDLEFHPLLALAYASLIFAAACAASALLVARNPALRELAPQQRNRTGHLDGLRGVLALGVFVHHSFTARQYLLTGHWQWSSSPVLNQLGQSTVALFFMITGYLFSNKLLNSRQAPIDWWQLYESRIRRLTPIYLVCAAAVALSVAALTHFELRESRLSIAHELLDWAFFAIPGRPDINAYPSTWTLMAGVNWSLRYEWIFYVCLPLLFWPLRFVASPKAARGAVGLLLAVLLRSIWHHHNLGHPNLYYVHFACGIGAALILRDPVLSKITASKTFRIGALASLGGLLLMQSADNALAASLGLIVFLSVANGASLFGLLKLGPVIWLGEVSYGIYLMHGLAIYWALTALDGAGLLRGLGVVPYAGLMAGVAASVTALASVSYVLLERPIMRWSWRRRDARLPASLDAKQA